MTRPFPLLPFLALALWAVVVAAARAEEPHPDQTGVVAFDDSGTWCYVDPRHPDTACLRFPCLPAAQRLTLIDDAWAGADTARMIFTEAARRRMTQPDVYPLFMREGWKTLGLANAELAAVRLLGSCPP